MIVKHKQTQQSLLDSTARLRALFESTSNLYILSIDKNAKIGSFNSKLKTGLKELLDYDVKEGDDFIDIFPQENYAKQVLLSRFNRALKGETLEMVAHFPSKAGREVWMQCFMNPIEVEGEEVREISFIAHDITEQIAAKERVIPFNERKRQHIGRTNASAMGAVEFSNLDVIDQADREFALCVTEQPKDIARAFFEQAQVETTEIHLCGGRNERNAHDVLGSPPRAFLRRSSCSSSASSYARTIDCTSG